MNYLRIIISTEGPDKDGKTSARACVCMASIKSLSLRYTPFSLKGSAIHVYIKKKTWHDHA